MRTIHSLGSLALVVGFVTMGAGCAAPADGDDDPVVGEEGAGADETVGTSSDAIAIGVGSNGCGSLFRKSSGSQAVYLSGCGTKFLGTVYRVPFNGFNVYHCFSSVGSQFVGYAGDLAANRAIEQDQPATKKWCDSAFPSIHSGGGKWN